MSVKTWQQALLACHNLLLRLYPPGFRAIFQDEIQSVFSQTISDAARQGSLAVIKVFLRELIDLPAAAFQEHRRERSANNASQAKLNEEIIPKLTRHEVFLAFAVFLIPTGLVLLNASDSPLVTIFVPPTMLVLILGGCVAGLIKRFPRWSLPYYGLVISGFVFLFLFQGEAQRISALLSSRFVMQPHDEVGRLLLVAFWDGMVWFTLLALMAFTFMLLSIIPGFRPLIQRLWDDWTRLSYLLYGSSVLALVLIYDAYQYPAGFDLMIITCLAAGAWGYLRSSSPSNRFLALLSGLSISILMTWAGKWIIVLPETWIRWFQADSLQASQWFEPQQTLTGLIWMVVVITLPILLRIIPRPRTPAL